MVTTLHLTLRRRVGSCRSRRARDARRSGVSGTFIVNISLCKDAIVIRTLAVLRNIRMNTFRDPVWAGVLRMSLWRHEKKM